MSLIFEQLLKTKWHEWKQGELDPISGCIFHQVIFDKTESGLRIRLVFEEDFKNQHVINICYDWLPGDFQIVLDAIGKEVDSVVAEGNRERSSYLVTFVDGYWFKI